MGSPLSSQKVACVPGSITPPNKKNPVFFIFRKQSTQHSPHPHHPSPSLLIPLLLITLLTPSTIPAPCSTATTADCYYFPKSTDYTLSSTHSNTSKERMTTLSQVELLDMAREVLVVCSHCSLQDIITDLTISKSAEATINRIFDGQVDLNYDVSID